MTQLSEYLVIKRSKNSQVLNAQLHKTSFSYFLVTVTHMFDFVRMTQLFHGFLSPSGLKPEIF